MTSTLLQRLRSALRRRNTCRQLLKLDDHLLADVGQNRAQLERELRQSLMSGLQDKRKTSTAPYLEQRN